MILNRITDIPGLNYFWQVDNLYLAGQPTQESLEHLKDYKFEKIINLRANEEGDFSFEEKFCKENGIEYFHFPIMVDGMLDLEASKKLSELVNGKENYFIHCASANRVGGWLITHLVKHLDIEFSRAVDIASQSGLSNPGFVGAASMVLENY